MHAMLSARIHLIFCSSRSERAKRRRLEIILLGKKALLNYCSGGRRVLLFSSNFLCFYLRTWEMSALCITLACAPNESEDVTHKGAFSASLNLK
jgi:hypothetical protein